MPIIPNKILLVAALIAISAFSYLRIKNYHLKAQNSALQNEKAQLMKDVEQLTKQQRINEEAYAQLSATQLQIRTKTKTVIKHIRDSPAGDDAKLAPVLRNALEAIE